MVAPRNTSSDTKRVEAGRSETGVWRAGEDGWDGAETLLKSELSCEGLPSAVYTDPPKKRERASGAPPNLLLSAEHPLAQQPEFGLIWHSRSGNGRNGMLGSAGTNGSRRRRSDQRVPAQ